MTEQNTRIKKETQRNEKKRPQRKGMQKIT